MNPNLAARLALQVRGADPDRYFSALFAPAAVRPFLFALYAFNHELARVAESVREPMLGAIRLEWWREAVEGAHKGMPRNHDVAKALAALFQAHALPPADFEAIIAARAFDANAERFADLAALENHVDATGGALMRLALKLLGADPALARAPALAYGLTGLLRSLPFHNARHKLYLPLDLLDTVSLTPETFFGLRDDPRVYAVAHQLALRAKEHFLAARRAARPRAGLPALLPAALVPVYLKNLAKNLGRDVPIHRRQMALLAAAVRGRL
ncbi:MAG TPA: squalene/phytoene synthase family protein [Rhizomicrobium sp.]|nr:squalene/phytoene synthase family protein [Rhizomicrobium sp.]